ncbi:hypothetical protein BH24DEI2_BH24DEI2_03440 [soil metagenome]
MNRLSHVLRRGLRCGLHCGLLVLVSVALAQDTDTVLQSYGLAVDRLNEAVRVLPEDGSLSSNALDQAAQTLRALSRDTSSPNLVAALERTFLRAETAVQNKSAADLSAQTAVLKGGFWRLVYESALRAANDGELNTSRARLLGVAGDMSFETPNIETLTNADTFGELILAFDKGAAAAVNARLQEASLLAADKPAAYLALAEAYARFLPVQDSPRVSAGATGRFSQTFQALVNDEAEAFQNGLADLTVTATDFQGAADAVAQQTAQPAEVTLETVTLETAALQPADSVAVMETTGTDAPALDAAGALVETTPTETPETTELLSLPAPPADATRSALDSAFASFGLDDARREDLIDRYVELGFRSVDDAVTALYADSARALSAIERGNQTAAQTQLESYQTTFERFVAPLLGTTSVGADTRQLVARFESVPGLRLQDGAVLVGQTDRVAGAVTGATRNAPNVLVATSLLWSGWIRLFVMIVLGLLAVVPLYLLNLAFGGANHNWRLIGAALFLLLLPVMYEGLSSLLELLADFTGIDALGTLAAYSIFQNTLSQVVWALLSAVAIALAVAGLYGICVQFGLLGKRSGADTLIATNETSLSMTTTNSAVDWDEEF